MSEEVILRKLIAQKDTQIGQLQADNQQLKLELAVEQEVIEPEAVKDNPEEFRCIGEEITEMLDYQPARFFRRQIIRRKFVRRQQPELAPIIALLPESLPQRCLAAPGLLAQVIKRGLAVTNFHQTEDEVIVQSGDQSFQSKWLVGCDGSRSIVRKTGGFEFAGTEPEFTGYSTEIDIADSEKLSPGRNLTPTGMYFQSQPGLPGDAGL